jgi:hypothetical protein
MRVHFIALSQNAKIGPIPRPLSSGRHAGRDARSMEVAATLNQAPSPCTGIAYPAAWQAGPGRSSAPRSRRFGPVVCGVTPRQVICRDTVQRSTVGSSKSSSAPTPANMRSPSPTSPRSATTLSRSEIGNSHNSRFFASRFHPLHNNHLAHAEIWCQCPQTTHGRHSTGHVLRLASRLLA